MTIENHPEPIEFELSDAPVTPVADTAPAKVRKPRAKKVIETRAALVLSSPTNLGGTKNTTLYTTVGKKFSRIVLLTPDGKHEKAVVRADEGEKATSLGSATLNFLYALVDAALAGQGAGPDGSATWVVDNYPKVKSYWSAEFPRYILKVNPAGRAGAQGYAGTIEEFLTIARAKAALINGSVKKFDIAKSVQRTARVREEIVPSITL